MAEALIDSSEIINSMLAGMKFKALQSDLQYSELKKRALESELGYQGTMQGLQIAHQRLLNDREELMKQGDTLANQLAEATMGSKISATSSEASRAASDASYSATRARVASATAGSEISKSKNEAKLTKAQLQSIGLANTGARVKIAEELGSALGAGDQNITPQDLEYYLDSLGIPSGETATRKTMGSYIVNQIQAVKAKTQQNNQEFDAKIGALKEEANLRRSAAVGNVVQAGINLAQAEAQNPGSIDAYASMANDDYTKQVVAIARSGASKWRAPLDPGEQEYGKKLADALVKQEDTVQAAKSRLENIDNETFGYTSRSKETARRRKALDEAVQLRDTLKEQLDNLGKGKSKVSKTTTTDEVPVVTTQADFDKLKSGTRYREEPNGPIFVKR